MSAARAAALETEFGRLLLERERGILNLMVTHFRSGKATHESLLACIAQIAELRRIRDEMGREARMAIEEMEAEIDGD